MKKYKQIQHQLELNDGILYRKYKTSYDTDERSVVVIPNSLARNIIQYAHDPTSSGHFSYEKTLHRIKIYAYGSGMHRDIFEFCVQGPICIEASSQKFKTNLHPLEIGSPWDTLSIDILESPSSKYGYGYFLVMQDHFIKCLEAAPIKSQSAGTVLREVNQLSVILDFP
ncbi:Protein NYNRIN [Thelohanellus kitauei]|uniref:Protein NYNRIN n=1 Tax=Thelohanellus kitauei TaxID=669202 RepID=A0A0C2J748_THEKT|nr:Protein NYNRIN [Thelohanellus kitauei]